MKVRPTSDMLKAAIFNVLFSMGGHDCIEGKTVLDVFAGTGALGIEAISRGAVKCYFIDNDIDSVSVIRKNLDATGIESKDFVILSSCMAGLSKLEEKGVKIDLVLMDPPYNKRLTLQAIESISKSSICNDNCIIVAEHSIKEELPEKINNFSKAVEKIYSDKVLSFFLMGNG